MNPSRTGAECQGVERLRFASTYIVINAEKFPRSHRLASHQLDSSVTGRALGALSAVRAVPHTHVCGEVSAYTYTRSIGKARFRP